MKIRCEFFSDRANADAIQECGLPPLINLKILPGIIPPLQHSASGRICVTHILTLIVCFFQTSYTIFQVEIAGMTSIEERLHRVETQLDRFTPSIHDRLDRLETAISHINATVPQSNRTPSERLFSGIRAFIGWMAPNCQSFLMPPYYLYSAGVSRIAWTCASNNASLIYTIQRQCRNC